MKLFESLDRRDNTIEVAIKLLSILKVNVTNTGLQDDLQRHSDYPSLLSLTDVLTSYGIENVAIKTRADDLAEMPMPCIAPIFSEQEEMFTVIQSASKDVVSYFNMKTLSFESISASGFTKKWNSGILMLVDAEGSRGEKEYAIKRKKEKLGQYYKLFWVSIFPAIILLTCFWALYSNGISVVFQTIFATLNMLGIIVSCLLLWYEIDESNAVLKQICKATEKVNCSAIITSGASKIAGVSWSAIGFVYFTGIAIFLLMRGLTNQAVLFAVAWLSAFALPHTIFSIYYQWRVAKQWCVLCLSVQAVLFFNSIIAFIGGWHSVISILDISVSDTLIPLNVAFLVPALTLAVTLPALLASKRGKVYQRETQRFKNNFQIFNTLLAKQKVFSESTEGLGITIGSKNPTYKVIKICNPFCGPCAKAHLPIEELLHDNPDVQVQIIFTIADQGDIRVEPVRHFMAIDEIHGEVITRKALDDWYESPKKDYKIFADKYPVNGALAKQDEKIRAMYDWCEKTQVSSTPTFIVNGYQLPEVYNISDLKYLLSV